MSIIATDIFPMAGGIHLPDNKSQSNNTRIQFAGIPDKLVLPVPDASSEVVVKVGQYVLKGEALVKPVNHKSAILHAPTSGVIHAIEDQQISHESGLSAPCIVLHSDGKDQWIDRQGVTNYLDLSSQELIGKIHSAGIVGLGGAGFPSSEKLNSALTRSIETLIINAAECEPYITADDRLIRERTEDISEGIKILQHIFKPVQKTYIGIEDNKSEAISILKNSINDNSISIAVFPEKYPSGGEKQLIQILTGKEVPSCKLPTDIGILCLNIATVYAIAQEILHGKPLISRITTVTGNACKKPGNYDVLIGTPIEFLLSQSGFDQTRCQRLIIGGPMTGYTASSTDIPVIKTTNCILAASSEEIAPTIPAQACIRCGFCAEVCPASLLPQQLYSFARNHEQEKLQSYNLFDCIECGACAYVCPSNIPLVQYYRAAKAEINEHRTEKLNADYYKARFEARQQRMDRLEAEKAAAKLARQEEAKKAAAEKLAEKTESQQKDVKLDVIQAAIERAKAKKLASKINKDNTDISEDGQK